MNANHARPLLAFWALAVAASVIIGVGLRSSPRDEVVSAGTPAPVHSSGAPELVLGGVLHARPGDVLTNPLAPDLWGAATGGTGSGVQVAAPSTTPTSRSHSNAGARPVGEPTGGAVTRPAVGGKPGKRHHGKTETTTATARPTTGAPGHGKGKGPGSGNTGGPGSGTGNGAGKGAGGKDGERGSGR